MTPEPSHPEVPPPGEPTQGVPGAPDQSPPTDQPGIDNTLPEGEGPTDPGYGVSEGQPSTLPDFNPSGNLIVAAIKSKVEALFEYLRENVPDNRERALAITRLEEGAMWAVKANFTGRPEPK